MRVISTSLACAALLAGVAISADASAEPTRNEKSSTWSLHQPTLYVEPMRRAMHEYFEGEARESWIFGGAGVVSLSAGALGLFAAKDDFYHGAAYPLLVFGAIQLGAGLVLGLRTHGQVEDLDTRLDHGHAFWEKEAPRMRRVQTQFAVLEIVELALLATGIGLATYGGFAKERFISGVGVGLAVQASAMLALDHLASERADRYAAAIARFGPR